MFYFFLSIDIIDVTTSKRASILQALVSPSALGTLFLGDGDGSREKLHMTLRCQFLASR